jgi:peptidoglycan/LPS O-acetylase OafA/YrhL
MEREIDRDGGWSCPELFRETVHRLPRGRQSRLEATEPSATTEKCRLSQMLQPRQGEFFEELESLRGIAALLIVLYHIPAGWYAPLGNLPLAVNGHVAVEFFFVLSGFVIFHTYGTRLGRVDALGRFALSRLGRLYPVHFLFMAIFIGIELAKYVGAAHDAIPGLTERHSLDSVLGAGLANSLLIHGLGFTRQTIFLNFPSWSISTEFYTYLLFGLAACFLPRRAFVVFAVMLTFASAAALAALGGSASQWSQILKCLLGFFLGCLTRVLYGKFAGRQLELEWPLLPLFLAGAVLCVPWHGDDWAWHIGVPLSAAIVFTVAMKRSGIAHCTLSSRPARWLGEISYSLYMCHALVLYIARHSLARLVPATAGHGIELSLPVAILVYAAIFAAVILSGWVTFVSVERPMKQWTKRALGGHIASVDPPAEALAQIAPAL